MLENDNFEINENKECQHVVETLSDTESINMNRSSTKPFTDKTINVPHLHSQYELFYNVSGAEGYMVNSKFYKLNERDLIIIPRWQIHRVIVKKKALYDRCVINIDGYIIELLELLCCSDNILSWLKGNYEKIPQKITLTLEQHEIFVSLIDRYRNLLMEDRNLEAFSVFMSLLSMLDNWFKELELPEPMDEEALSYVDRVIRIIEENFKTITVSQIASKIAVNSDYLNRIFKDEWNVTISKYLIMRRIAEAKMHLCKGKNAKEACYLSGFKDYSNFLRTFKKYEGYSPNSITDADIDTSKSKKAVLHRYTV